jgi:glycosyltransferase involved in cell wall biosynthesis
MKGKQLVSIVLPVYNGANFLRASIQSCLEQTYADLELIVVDDGSKDNSVEIVNSYHDDRVRLFRHPVNRRIPGALNTGFAHSSGAYLTWTSHDNTYASTAIAEMVSFLEEHQDVDFVFANQYDINTSSEIIGEVKPGPFERLIEGCYASGAFLYRRSVYEKIGGYDERLYLAQDYDYWLRASTHFKLAHLDRFLYYNLVHQDSCTSRFSTEVIEEELAVKRKILGTHPWRNRLPLYNAHMHAALCFSEMDRQGAAARALVRAIAYRPKCLTQASYRTLLLKILVGQSGFGVLRRVKRVLRSEATHHS